MIKRCCGLIQGGLTYYGKARGLLVNYTQDRNGFETMLMPSFKETPESMRMGTEFFDGLKMFVIPIENV